MHIILTHEQADFDAIASLLGAYLLDSSSIPVLPRRLNRNVRAFLTLYGMELPFIEQQDLSGNQIEQVTLVDTQSLTSAKGMGKHTRVRVIDHHPLRDDLPDGWQFTLAGTGANTTLFVEVLQDKDIPLSVVHATLLLLGIYEDTGSLTYSRTRSRDLRAASFLLDHGARLELAVDYLNHPLSDEQQKLYDELREHAENVQIQGHTVLLSKGDASEINEEISTVAHKMQDLLDPDALILLVKIQGGIQMVARSTSDQIDVGEIAKEFGGGGHARAAAGLIKDAELELVYYQMLEVLPKFIHPAVRVNEIMSRGPHVLEPDISARDASVRMQRYGYEGFPVVQDGKVIGLLTRRAVDRALSHQLNLDAVRLMDAGNYSVTPDDSIERLQEVMTASGWGQIPVVQPGTETIVGIVTRTDLLKTFTRDSLVPVRDTVRDRFEAALDPIRLSLLLIIAEKAEEQRAALFVVGGFVRDLLLEVPSQDLDLVVEGDAIELGKLLAKIYSGRITSHSQFGTAKWVLDNQNQTLRSALLQSTRDTEFEWSNLPDSIDLVSARTEFYKHPTALPTVERGSIKLDLHRRDFTINTLAIRLDGRHYGELHDYWGGYSDLHKGVIRVLHSLSFVDDPTRIMRAIRFAERFGFKIESRTMELLQLANSMLGRISGDRIRHEIDHIWKESKCDVIMWRLMEIGVFSAIHPDLCWGKKHSERIVRARLLLEDPEWQDYLGSYNMNELMYVVWLIDIPEPGLRNILKRLRFAAKLRNSIQSGAKILRVCSAIETGSPSQVVKLLDDNSPLAVAALYSISCSEAVNNKISSYVVSWHNVEATITGNDLKDLGLTPGPMFRRILDQLRSAWLDGVIRTKEDEEELLRAIITREVTGTNHE